MLISRLVIASLAALVFAVGSNANACPFCGTTGQTLSGEVSQAQDGVRAGLDSIDLGPLKDNQGDQDYDLPAAVDLTQYDVAIIYNKRRGAISASAKLQPF